MDKTRMSATLGEQARGAVARHRLQRSRALATSLLLVAALLFAFAVWYQPRYPALGYLKAFAEAAMVGALADWFAVTALFRRPLGLPIPHTAILPRKQERIADELGRFIEHNFLQSQSIALRIYQAHPSEKLLAWLAQPHNKTQWLPWLTVQIPRLLRVAKPHQFARFGSQMLAEQYNGRKLGETLASVLNLLRQQGLDTMLLRVLLQQVRHCLQDDNTRAQLEKSLLAWAGRIERAVPSNWDKIKATLKTTLAERVDDWVAAKVLAWADSYVAAALADNEHALWRVYARQVDVAAHKLRHSRVWHRRLQAGKQQLAHSEALNRILAQSWQSLCLWSEDDVCQDNSLWRQQLEKLFNHMLSQAVRYPRFMRRVDVHVAWWTRQVVERHKHQGAGFVADKVKSWDSRQMVEKLELSVGRDLQFIRINGTLVGGLAGVLIYVLAQWLTPA